MMAWVSDAQIAVVAAHDFDGKLARKYLQRRAAHNGGVPASSRM